MHWPWAVVLYRILGAGGPKLKKVEQSMKLIFFDTQVPTKYVIKNYFSYFSIKTHVVGTQKSSLIETVLLSTQLIG